MEKSKLYIFTEGGDGIGFGHITRCGALYEEAVSRGIECEFIVYGKNIENSLKGFNYQIKDWRDKNYLSNLLTEKDYAIVDSYKADKEIYECISEWSKKALYIDDIQRLEYPKGIVVNPSLYGKQISYPEKDGVNYLLGPDYIILRKEFRNPVIKPQKDEIENILVTLGGTDIRNLTPKILKILREINKNFKVKVVIGNAFDNLEEIKKELWENVELLYNLDGNQMKNAMEESDFVISACGQTINELLALRIPFFPIVVIDNQINNSRGLIDLGIIEQPIFFDEENIERILNEKISGIKKIELSKKINGFGTNKIISFLTEEFAFFKAGFGDRKEIYDLSNKDYVRKYSLNKNKIPYEEHLKWYENSLKNPNIYFYLLKDFGGNLLAQVRFSVLDNIATISLSFSERIKGQGKGSLILKESINLFWQETELKFDILAYVNEENSASVKIFNNNGFEFMEKKDNLIKLILKSRRDING